MKTKWLLLCVILSLGLFSFGQDADSEASPPQDLSATSGQHNPPMLGIHWARGFDPFARFAKGSNPNMTYHGGVIMQSTVSQAIFWGTSWATYSGDKISGLDSWYTGFSNSNYAKTSDEYTGSNGQVGPVVPTMAISSTPRLLPMEVRLPRLLPKYAKGSATLSAMAIIPSMLT